MWDDNTFNQLFDLYIQAGCSENEALRYINQSDPGQLNFMKSDYLKKVVSERLFEEKINDEILGASGYWQ